MQKNTLICTLLTGLVFASPSLSARENIPPVANGISVPLGYQNWRLISVSHRLDNDSLRIIVGNTVAVNAARSGKTNPWPVGSVIGKLVWKDSQHPDWEKATVPGELSHIEFMIKDPLQYKKTGGWGYARWVGEKTIPYGKDATFAQECFACHGAVKNNDYVFTKPAPLPH